MMRYLRGEILLLLLLLLLLQDGVAEDSKPEWHDEELCGAASFFVEVVGDDLRFYWPGVCDRCHILARNSTEAVACCRGENSGWDCDEDADRGRDIGSHNMQCGGWNTHREPIEIIEGMRQWNTHQCSRYPNATEPNSFPMRLRKHLRYRYRDLPPSRGSALDRFVDLVGARKVFFLGDSVLKQFVQFIYVRAQDLERAKIAKQRLSSFLSRNVIFDEDCWNHQPRCNLTLAMDSAQRGGAIVISSFGHHFSPDNLNFNRGKRFTYKQVLLEHLQQLNEVGSLKKTVAMHLGVFAQHFVSPTGQFPPLFPRDGKVKYSKWYHSMQPNSWFDEHPGMQYQHQYLPYRCMPPTARDYDCQDNKKAVVARIADAVARNESFRAVHFPPFQRTTQELYDIHFGSADCTHFCYMPGFIEAGIHLINEAIAAAASSESAVGGATGEV